MRVPKTPAFAAVAGLLVPGAAKAAELSVSVEIPKLTVAEYHRPYVALWIEKPDQSAVKTLAVWYDVKLKKNEGTTWLKDMRQWWRRAGRAMTLPADGVSGPTKAPGKHEVRFTAAQIGALPPGEYSLAIEAAREVGEREVVRAPFSWPPKAAKTTKSAGTVELGAVGVTAKP